MPTRAAIQTIVGRYSGCPPASVRSPESRRVAGSGSRGNRDKRDLDKRQVVEEPFLVDRPRVTRLANAEIVLAEGDARQSIRHRSGTGDSAMVTSVLDANDFPVVCIDPTAVGFFGQRSPDRDRAPTPLGSRSDRDPTAGTASRPDPGAHRGSVTGIRQPVARGSRTRRSIASRTRRWSSPRSDRPPNPAIHGGSASPPPRSGARAGSCAISASATSRCNVTPRAAA